MDREEHIKKWLSGELSEKELREFESSEAFARISRLQTALQRFKAPPYDVEGEYRKLSNNLNRSSQADDPTARSTQSGVSHRSAPKSRSLSASTLPLLRIAALFVVALAAAYFAVDRWGGGMGSQEWISGVDQVFLPDSSEVLLNSGSSVRFSEGKWERNRDVELQGEAFFRVKEGSTFRVLSPQGTVTVLGTEFTVADWEAYFQVTCYSGKVGVSASGSTAELMAHTTFRIIEEKAEQYPVPGLPEPAWLRGESRFKSVPLSHVMDELERQYGITIDRNNVSLDQQFTGGFTHSDLNLALESITIPVNLEYEITADKTVRIIEVE